MMYMYICLPSMILLVEKMLVLMWILWIQYFIVSVNFQRQKQSVDIVRVKKHFILPILSPNDALSLSLSLQGSRLNVYSHSSDFSRLC